MKLPLRSIILAVPALSKLAASDLSLHLTYRLKKSMDALQKEADFFSEQRKKIFSKYGTPQADGGFSFSEEAEPQAISELDALLDMEVTPDVSVLDIPVSENLRLSVNDLTLLAPFIHFVET